MTEGNHDDEFNLVHLPPGRRPPDHAKPSSQHFHQVRHQLLLLQGYTELMQGLSPGQQTHVMRVMAEKTTELVGLLAPFSVPGQARGPVMESYRQARQRSRRLVADYRRLLNHLHEITRSSPPIGAEGQGFDIQPAPPTAR